MMGAVLSMMMTMMKKMMMEVNIKNGGVEVGKAFLLQMELCMNSIQWQYMRDAEL
jgi:hypothetical protein